MPRDSKRLEALVAFVEKTLVPEGFKVTTNDRVFNDDGIQVAEFDVLVQGKIGTSEFQWLIECRDRPSSGASPTSWIEQLVGRRTRFNLSKVTAVSTTGFAAGAHEFAHAQGIELREVLALSPEHFADWLEVRYITNTVHHTNLTGVYFALEPETPQLLHDALASMLPGINGSVPLLRALSNGEVVTPAQAFSGVTSANQELFDGLEPNGEPKIVRLLNRYPDDDHFVIQTAQGDVPIKTIEFTGELSIKEFKLPIGYTGEYRDAKTGTPISQVVTYAPQSIMGNKFAVELHKLAASGETHITMRRFPNAT
ncbi:MAG: restriction endonuclease [Nitrospira sp.]|nr:restriction endonuclease [Nitrospira sp.]